MARELDLAKNKKSKGKKGTQIRKNTKIIHIYRNKYLPEERV